MDREPLVSVTKKDLRIDTFRSGGKGGQNQNKRDTGVRITHRDSGAVGESREHRTQEENKKAAFRRMAATSVFNLWLKKETSRALGIQERVEQTVEEQMQEKNLLVEVKDEEGLWVSEDE